MAIYTFVAEKSNGLVIAELTVSAECCKSARRLAWQGLTEEQRDATSSLECVDEVEA